MICKDEDTCTHCIRRRKKECGYEPIGFGPDCDGEFGVACDGMLTQNTLMDAYLDDSLQDYHGIGDPIRWDLLYPVYIWSAFNLMDHTIDCDFVSDWWNDEPDSKKDTR